MAANSKIVQWPLVADSRPKLLHDKASGKFSFSIAGIFSPSTHQVGDGMPAGLIKSLRFRSYPAHGLRPVRKQLVRPLGPHCIHLAYVVPDQFGKRWVVGDESRLEGF